MMIKNMSSVSFGTNVENLKPYFDKAKERGYLKMEHLKIMQEFKNDGEDGSLEYYADKYCVGQDALRLKNYHLDKACEIVETYDKEKNGALNEVCKAKIEQIKKELSSMTLYDKYFEKFHKGFKDECGVKQSRPESFFEFLDENPNLAQETKRGTTNIKTLVKEFEKALPDENNFDKKYIDIFG